MNYEGKGVLAGKRIIKKVAVLGSGVMGSQIALHLAGCGLQVLLLDIAPNTLLPAEEAKGLDLNSKAVKNRIVESALAGALKLNPNPLYHTRFLKQIKTGNFSDNLSEISEADWVIEVVVENLGIKQNLFEKVDALRKPGTIISSNTSGIPIHLMSEGRSEDFRKHFCGTHFFNPPRYLKLLEIIPSPETDPSVTEFLLGFGQKFLGKTTVQAKDQPAFIANRIGIFSIMETLKLMYEFGFGVDDIDKLTGPVIGRPKSATFRTIDVVGLDTLIKVADNLVSALPYDEKRAVFEKPAYLSQMLQNGWIGDKKGQGFYKKATGPDGSRQILSLDLQTMVYAEHKAQRFASLEAIKTEENLVSGIKSLLEGKDKAAAFYQKMWAGLFAYASNRIPEIADSLYQIDKAICAGFGWELGIFETWDAIGFENGIQMAVTANETIAPWVFELQAKGFTSFYTNLNGKKHFADPVSQTYKLVPGQDNQISLAILKKATKVWGNSGTSVIDLGDGILNLEFHTKMNILGGEVVEGLNKAINLAEQQFQGLVIANEGANFSAGANLALVLMLAIEQDYDELDLMIRTFQQTMMRVRYSSIPVVVAPHGLCLGGGCEMSLHADALQLVAETYIGLVETGVGLIPGGGGTKETALRLSDAYQNGDPETNRLQTAFMNIAMAKVTSSAFEATDYNILRKGDGISISSDNLISDAKAKALQLASAGYVQPQIRNDIRVMGRSGLALLKVGINGMLTGNYISEHDALVASKLAWVLCGADLSYPQPVGEQYLLDLEREAFLSLLGEHKTLKRIEYTLKTGKPLRN